jgi:hypothetical protein
MNGNSKQDDPKENLPKELKRLPKFGGSKKSNKIQKNYQATQPIDFPSEKNLSQKLALSALKYSGQASIKPEIEDTARDLLEINQENNLAAQKLQQNNLDQTDDAPPAPPAPFI